MDFRASRMFMFVTFLPWRHTGTWRWFDTLGHGGFMHGDLFIFGAPFSCSAKEDMDGERWLVHCGLIRCMRNPFVSLPLFQGFV